MESPPEQTPDDPTDWFRQPTRREHWIAAALFAGFGLFFIALFVVLAGWWFRWIVLVLGIYSIVHAIGHARDARHAKRVGD
jgi:fatty acid desaturase